MEKRLVIFLVLSVFILTSHVLVRNMLFPPPPREVEQPVDLASDDPAPDPKEGAKILPADGDAATGNVAAEQPGTPDRPADATLGAGDPKQPSEAGEEQPDAPPPAQQWLTMGSFAPTDPHHLMVTFSNLGAAIERVTLVQRDAKGRLRYRDLGKQHGYLGLYCRNTPDGCVVKVVGPGTPAALATPADGTLGAGFIVGDVILSANDIPLGDATDLATYLSSTKPGQSVTFSVRRAAVQVPIQLATTLEYHPLELVEPEVTLDGSPTPSLLLGIHSVGKLKATRDADELPQFAALRNSTWEIAQSSPDEVVFTKRVKASVAAGDELEFVRRFRWGSAPSEADVPQELTNYHLQMEVEIRNLSSESQTVSYTINGPNGLPQEGWWYTNKIHPSWGTAGARDVIWRVHGNRHSLRSASEIYKQAQESPENPLVSVLTDNPAAGDRTLDYLGVDTQYFSAVLLGGTMDEPKAFTCERAFAMPVGQTPELQSRATKTLNTSFRMVTVPTPIEPGQSATDQYHLFLGPKSPDVLASYNLGDIIEYGWFGWIAKPLSKVLHFFYSIFRNYGLAIVLLTVLVRGAMFPIGRKAARNAQVMQELAPEIKKIKEKYKNDLEKQGQAQRELWKRHNFNPLSGCWLMFLQFPIFIGLYRCLSVDINLRQAPLIPGLQWCSNLAGPDMAWKWEGVLPDMLASETGWLGPYLNILPIVTIILFIAQQKMFTPPATDEQTQMQQKMMKYMMIFMGVLFFKVPAGLCVYFIASSLWGIGERKLLPKPSPESAQNKPAPEQKKDSWLQKIKDRVQDTSESDAADAARQRRKRRRP